MDKKNIFETELIEEIDPVHDEVVSNPEKPKEKSADAQAIEAAARNRRIFRLTIFSVVGLLSVTGAGLLGYTYYMKQAANSWESVPAAMPQATPPQNVQTAPPIPSAPSLKEPVPTASDQAMLAQLTAKDVSNSAAPSQQPAPTGNIPAIDLATMRSASARVESSSQAVAAIDEERIRALVQEIAQEKLSVLAEETRTQYTNLASRIDRIAQELNDLKQAFSENKSSKSSKSNATTATAANDSDEPRATKARPVEARKVATVTIVSRGDGFVIGKTKKGALVYFAEGEKTPFGVVLSLDSDRIHLSGNRYVALES